MTSLERLKPALRSAWLPLALLLLALLTVFIFGGDREQFYRPAGSHNWMSSKHLTIAVNISPEHGFQRFTRRFIEDDGTVGYFPYNRFPIGGYVSMKLATLPFSDNPSARLTAARVLMLLFFTAAAVLAYLSLSRLTSNRWIALTATLLSFSSLSLLYYNDTTANEVMPDFFGVMLTFHGMVIFVQEGRFRQLLIKTCIALLLGWHVLALLAPFIVIGLGSEILRARSAAASSTSSPLRQAKRIASTLLRSRYLLLGVVALGFALSLLTFNFTMEYVALDGETPLTELPSLQSMLSRTSVVQSSFLWGIFLESQFLRIFLMFVPYALIGSGGILESLPWQTESSSAVIRGVHINVVVVKEWLSEFQSVILGVALSGACLIGLMFTRQRMLFATLASSGFFWALALRNSTYGHDFEAIYYIGLPLVFFTIVLLLVKRLTNRDGVIAAASVIALLIFAVSSFQMSHVGHDAETDRDRAAIAAEQEMLVIRELTAGEFVTLQMSKDHLVAWWDVGFEWDYYLNSSPFNYAYTPAAEGTFVVTRQRIDIDSLLTPQNEYFFLYDMSGTEPWYAATYRSVTSREPLARGDFDLYQDRNQSYYLIKEPCTRADTRERFYLHVIPEDIDDLPDHRREHGFDNLDFAFPDQGILFDNKCLVRFVLPQYAISQINFGRFGEAWSVVHYFRPPKLILESQQIASNEPVARSEFDLYLDSGKLYYLKEPCSSEDTAARFFLHIVPEDVDDLPDKRKQYGFDNLDFDFNTRGVLFEGTCAARVDLPQYGIAQITTGQHDGAWNVVHYFRPPKLILESQRIISSEPATSSGEFDLYLDSGKLYYLKEPCSSEDTAARFFLHIIPEDVDDLPDKRKQYGFDNLDFDFNARGVLFEGTCVARVDLPQYGIVQITTGQYDGAWNVVHYLRPPKLILESQQIASNEPAARSEFDLYLDSGKLYYLKEPCSSEDTAARFFLHIIPEDVDDLPDKRKQYGFDNMDFDFGEHGLLFEGKCVARVDLPQYGIVQITTGQYDGAWNVVHYLRPPKLILESQQIASSEPAARSEFDVYVNGGKLYYFKEPCAEEDTAARFFLHIVPEDVDDLPDKRKQYGFDNLDFDFGEHGLLFEGTCAARVDLPQYGIASVSTGQFDVAGGIWAVELAPDALE